MSTSNKGEDSPISVIEAVEILSDIAEMDFDRSFLISDSNDPYIDRKINWVIAEEAIPSIEAIQEVFQVILNYLKNYYRKEYRYMPSQKMTEGIKAIMVLVGEAAKKLDRFTLLSKGRQIKSITSLKEYKKLQDFYIHQIAHKIDEGVLSKWILALSQKFLEKKDEKKIQIISTKHIFVDLESVKKDIEYELFFIKKEDGTRYFNPKLIRNIKLVCDFGDQLSGQQKDDPLESMLLWQDQIALENAKSILHYVSSYIEKLYNEPLLQQNELGNWIKKATLALLLSANNQHLYHDPMLKRSRDYFLDFIKFLREGLHCREYQRIVAYPLKKHESHLLFDLTNALCFCLYTHLKGFQVILPHIMELINEATLERSSEHVKKGANLKNELMVENAALLKLLKSHSNKPLIKILNILEEDINLSYEPFLLEFYPNYLFTFSNDTIETSCLHIPSPTSQEVIDKAFIVEEFKGFLRSLKKQKKQHLLINLQDRMSWKDEARSSVIEELQKQSDFEDHLLALTLPCDTEFYNQEFAYQNENHATIFIKVLKNQVFNEGTGFYFPAKIKESLKKIVPHLIEKIHRTFFGSKNTLTLEFRQNFIQLFYIFLTWEVLKMTKCSSFSFTCKDGIDNGNSFSALFYFLLKTMEKEILSKHDIEYLNMILYAPPLLQRQRLINQDRFKRVISILKEIESIKIELGFQGFKEALKDIVGCDYSIKVI